jgi:predicted alpha/beta hydrolase family esterase
MLEYYKNFNIDEDWGGRSWKDWLEWTLGEKYNFIKMKRPTSDNADYEVWKIVFQKYLEKIQGDRSIFVGHSLGTIFLLKYFSENGLPEKIKKIRQLHLVASIVSNQFHPVDDVEDTGTFTFDITSVTKLKEMCEEVHIWHSEDDPMCSVKNAVYLKEQIPTAVYHQFTDRGHFVQPVFVELFNVLNKL